MTKVVPVMVILGTASGAARWVDTVAVGRFVINEGAGALIACPLRCYKVLVVSIFGAMVMGEAVRESGL